MKNVYLLRLPLMLAMLHVCALSWAATGSNRALSEFDSGAAFAENVLIDPIDCTNGESYSNDATDGYADAPGFESWVFNHQGNAGNFIGNSASNGNSGPSGDINTGGQAWGLFANSGGTANQIRPLTNPLAEGDKISLAMDNGSIDNGGSVGFGLQNANGENLIEFYFNGGENSYTFNAADGATPSGIGFTGAGLHLSFEVASGGNVNIEVTTLSDGSTYNFTRTLNNPVGGQAVRQVRFFNFNAGGGSERDAFFNSLELCYALEFDCNGDLGGSAFVDGCGTCVSGNTGALACLDLEIACPQPQPEVVSLEDNCQGEVPDLTEEPFEAVLASPEDFAGVQGEPWLYGMYAFGDFNGFELLPNWTGNVWNNPGATLGFPQLDANGGHPEIDSPDRNPVRRWVSDVDGQVRVYGDFFDRNTTCGDGVNVRIYQNGVQFYEYLNVP